MLRMRARPRPPGMRGAETEAGPVLLVDPDPDCREIGTVLLRYFGYEVRAAESFQEGVRLARALRPRAVLSEVDHDPPGETLVERLKGDPATAAIPVLVLSAHVLPEYRERALAAGAAAFLAKPCDGEALRSVLAEVAGAPRPA
ncbi:MAG TPA: response regulator [Longimicrobium sp.]|nr:response regulator [Longimicrobium sp.]